MSTLSSARLACLFTLSLWACSAPANRRARDAAGEVPHDAAPATQDAGASAEPDGSAPIVIDGGSPAATIDGGAPHVDALVVLKKLEGALGGELFYLREPTYLPERLSTASATGTYQIEDFA